MGLRWGGARGSSMGAAISRQRLLREICTTRPAREQRRTISSITFFPTISTPASSSACTAAACRSAAGCVASQAGEPLLVCVPAIAKQSLTAVVRPCSGPAAAPCTCTSPM